MRVLIACEFSGIIREAFRRRGHDAYSCDLLQSEIPSPFHIQDDVLNHLSENWDMMISHPPCTFLCRHRARWESRENVDEKRKNARDFFLSLLNASIEHICVENPVPLKTANLPEYQQIIQPWQFGHDYSKKTCLWLKNLPLLQPTNVVKVSYVTTPNGKRYTKGWYETPRKWKPRSRTFQGIADAMADQWGSLAPDS